MTERLGAEHVRDDVVADHPRLGRSQLVEHRGERLRVRLLVARLGRAREEARRPRRARAPRRSAAAPARGWRGSRASSPPAEPLERGQRVVEQAPSRRPGRRRAAAPRRRARAPARARSRPPRTRRASWGRTDRPPGFRLAQLGVRHVRPVPREARHAGAAGTCRPSARGPAPPRRASRRAGCSSRSRRAGARACRRSPRSAAACRSPDQLEDDEGRRARRARRRTRPRASSGFPTRPGSARRAAP